MNKGLTITLITLLSLLVIGIIIGLIFLIRNGFTFNMDNYSTNLIEEKEIENIKDLNINFNNIDLEIKESKEDIIKIELYSDYEKDHKIEETEDSINVELYEENKFVFFKKTGRIIIYLPEDYKENISANGSVGDINIGTLDKANIEVELSTGDIKAKELYYLRATLTTGDIKIEKVNNIVTKMSTGDIKIEKVNNYIEASLKTGDIKIEKLDINENSKIELTTGDVKIKDTNDIYVDAETNTGDTKIGSNNRKAEIEIVIRVHTGDIKVKK